MLFTDPFRTWKYLICIIGHRKYNCENPKSLKTGSDIRNLVEESCASKIVTKHELAS